MCTRARLYACVCVCVCVYKSRRHVSVFVCMVARMCCVCKACNNMLKSSYVEHACMYLYLCVCVNPLVCVSELGTCVCVRVRSLNSIGKHASYDEWVWVGVCYIHSWIWLWSERSLSPCCSLDPWRPFACWSSAPPHHGLEHCSNLKDITFSFSHQGVEH